ncbi:MAG: hypothetical protein WA049_13285 [Ferribacterium limneticum]
MARNLLRVSDAIDRAKGINSGLDGLVSLLLGCNDADVPDGKTLAELIWSVQKDMDTALAEAASSLKQ